MSSTCIRNHKTIISSTPICYHPKCHNIASMVKWTNIVLRYTKIVIVLVKGLKVVAKCCLNYMFFSTRTFIVVLNNQMLNTKLRSSELIVKSDAHKQMVESIFERRFHDLKYLEFGIFHIPSTHYTLHGIITTSCRKPSV